MQLLTDSAIADRMLTERSEREDEDERDDGWECPRCGRQVKRDTRGRVCPHCGWYEG